MSSTLQVPTENEPGTYLDDLRQVVRRHEAGMGVTALAQLMYELDAAVLAVHGPQVWPTVDDLIAEMAQRQQRLALEARQEAIQSTLALYGSLGRHDALLALPAGTGAQHDAPVAGPVTPSPADDAATTPDEDGIIEAEIVADPKPVRASRKPRTRRPAAEK